ncbi:dynein heavy chain domain-containing protein 1-like, partial [Tubulanus polymorphus]|uniref:dynein heavy chain domain-containing protein 1-like n=1 Tax=Tubulanus polymorphus TaxID=672921 RepID=UPI003DA5DE48
WARDVRSRISTAKFSEVDVTPADIHNLKQELVKLIIVVVQQNDCLSWDYLSVAVRSLFPIRELLQGSKEIYHYLERIYDFIRDDPDDKLTVFDALKAVFPQEMQKISSKTTGKNPFNVGSPSAAVASAAAASAAARGVNLTPIASKFKTPPTQLAFPSKKNLFRTNYFEEYEEINLQPAGLTFSDLRKSLPAVAFETATRESLWGHCLGLTAHAMDVDLPDPEDEMKDKTQSSSAGSRKFKKKTSSLSSSSVKSLLDVAHLKTGREAVEYFMKCFHTGRIEFAYFNIAANRRHYTPYELIETSKQKADDEHYVFSTFGVIHVQGLVTESMSLTDWLKDAVLHAAVSKIPFFKYFLVLKSMRRWQKNVSICRFEKMRSSVEDSMIQCVPLFSAALLQVEKLMKELTTLELLPLERDQSYPLVTYERTIEQKTKFSEKVLERFYRFCKMILEMTEIESYKKVQYCEEQLQHKMIFSKDSLHLQKVKKEQRQANLVRAKFEVERLPIFYKLIDQIVLSNLIDISISNVLTFVNEVMKNASAERDGLFQAFLQFSDNDELCFCPNREIFMNSVSDSIFNIPHKLSDIVRTIDYEDITTYRSTKRSQSSYSEFRLKPIGHKLALPSLRDPDTATPSMITQTAAETEQTDRKTWNSLEFKLDTPTPLELATVDKREDDLGVATPDLVHHYSQIIPPIQQTDRGSDFVALSAENLKEKLNADESYRRAIDEYETLMTEAFDEIDQYCAENNWLKEISQFTRSWTNKSTAEWKGAPPFTFEQKLTEIRTWIERIKSFDHQFLTRNRVVFVNCTNGIHELLVPRLNEIHRELCHYLARETRNLAKTFVEEMDVMIENMKDKQTTLDKFAAYSKNLQQYKEKKIHYQQHQEYIRQLFEVIRMSYRQLNGDEEKLETSVSNAWDDFIQVMSDANTFVVIQTPLLTKSLDDTYQNRMMNVVSKISRRQSTKIGKVLLEKQLQQHQQQSPRKQSEPDNNEITSAPSPRKLPSVSPTKLEGIDATALMEILPILPPSAETAPSAENRSSALDDPPSDIMKLEDEANRLVTEATSGKYLNPSSNCYEILTDLRQLFAQFIKIRDKLHEVSDWKKTITGESCDLEYLKDLQAKMEIRHELWKYLDTSISTIQDWRNMLFRKLNVKKILEKIHEWQGIAVQMKRHVPLDDQVLIQFYRNLQEFKSYLPILNKLSSQTLKERHWRQIFVGMGEQYDASVQFTVNELLSLNIVEHSQSINTVYQAALAEYELEMKICKLKKLWEGKEFKLAKHILDSVFAKGEEVNSTPAKHKMTKVEKLRTARDNSSRAASPVKQLYIDQNRLYILTNIEQLKYQLQESRVCIESMLVSPYLGDHRVQAEFWSTSLKELEELINLWNTCQKKWLYLLKVFEVPEVYCSLGELSSKFEDVNKTFLDFMDSVVCDATILSLTSFGTKRRLPVTAIRPMQGEHARVTLQQLLIAEEMILKDLDSVYARLRREFPRFYFLSDGELIDVMSISRNPDSLIPYVRKLFPGIHNLTFKLPPSKLHNVNSSLDYAINAHKLLATEIEGNYGEKVPLTNAVQPTPRLTQWMNDLEFNMKSTLASVLQHCLQARLEEGTKSSEALQLLGELKQLEENLDSADETERLKQQIHHTFEHWLLRFPVQCVIVADSVLFNRTVAKILDEHKFSKLESVRSNIAMRIDQYSEALKENFDTGSNSETRQRLNIVLTNLINQSIHQRDLINGLLDRVDFPSDLKFEWMKTLKHEVTISETVQAVASERDLTESEIEQQQTQRKQIRRNSTRERAPRLQTTKVTATTKQTYEFGSCVVRQLGYAVPYDYEYYSPHHDLVFTPLTDRAYLTLMMSLQVVQCGSLTGRSATGKTDTIQNLAQMLGRHLVTVSCSQSLDLPQLLRYTRGILQAGSWVLFDEVQSIEPGILSVFAEQLEYICNSVRALNSTSSRLYESDAQQRRTNSITHRRTRRHSVGTLHSADLIPRDTRQCLTHKRRRSIDREMNITDEQQTLPLFTDKLKQFTDSESDISDSRSRSVYQPGFIGYMMFNGEFIQARSHFGCFMTLNTGNRNFKTIPDAIKLLMRPCALVVPDIKVVVETSLICRGFTDAAQLTKKIVLLTEFLNKQMSLSIGMRILKQIVELAAFKIHVRRKKHEAMFEADADDNLSYDGSENHQGGSSTPVSARTTESTSSHLSRMDLTTKEEYAIIYGFVNVLGPRLDSDAGSMQQFKELMRTVFPQSSRPKSGVQPHDPVVMSAVQEQMARDNLQVTSEPINKILQLYTTLQSSVAPSIVLLGAAGSGKTTCYQTLARAMNALHTDGETADAAGAADDFDQLNMETGLRRNIQQTINVLRGVKDERQHMTKYMNKWRNVSHRLNRLQNLYNDILNDNTGKTSRDYPQIDIEILHPNMFTTSQLFGEFSSDAGVWETGILANLLKNSAFQIQSAEIYRDKQQTDKTTTSKNQTTTDVDTIQKLIVLDGNIGGVWVNGMMSVFDDERRLKLPNGSTVVLQDSISLIFETSTLENASPAIVAKSQVIHIDGAANSWKSLVESWCTPAKNRYLLTSSCLRVIQELCLRVFAKTLAFIDAECSLSLSDGRTVTAATPGIHQVSATLKILSALMERYLLRDELEKQMQRKAQFESDNNTAAGSAASRLRPRSSQSGGGGRNSSRSARSYQSSQSSAIIEENFPNYINSVKALFTYAFIWGFGGQLHESCVEKFDHFVRQTMFRDAHRVVVPDDGSVFDYCVDMKSGSLVRWTKVETKPKNVGIQYLMTPELERYVYIMDLLVSSNQQVLLTGAPGVGKSSLLQSVIVPKNAGGCRFVCSTDSFTPEKLRNGLMRHVGELRNKRSSAGNAAPNVTTATAAKIPNNLLFVLDDLHMTSYDERRGIQPTLEAVRSIASTRSVYDYQRKLFTESPEIQLLLSWTCQQYAGSGLGLSNRPISPRLSRLFVTINMTTPSDESLHGIYGKMLSSWLHEFPTYALEHTNELSKAMFKTVLDMYECVRLKFRPSPVNPHYIFTLHDLSHIVRGMLLLSPRATPGLAGGGSPLKSKPSKKTSKSNKGSGSVSSGDLLSDNKPPMMRSVVRLCCHEITRTFYDRLVSDEDKTSFGKLLNDVVLNDLCSTDDGDRSRSRLMSGIKEENSFIATETIRSAAQQSPDKLSTVSTDTRLSTPCTPAELPSVDQIVTTAIEKHPSSRGPGSTEPPSSAASQTRVSSSLSSSSKSQQSPPIIEQTLQQQTTPTCDGVESPVEVTTSVEGIPAGRSSASGGGIPRRASAAGSPVRSVQFNAKSTTKTRSPSATKKPANLTESALHNQNMEHESGLSVASAAAMTTATSVAMTVATEDDEAADSSDSSSSESFYTGTVTGSHSMTTVDTKLYREVQKKIQAQKDRKFAAGSGVRGSSTGRLSRNKQLQKGISFKSAAGTSPDSQFDWFTGPLFSIDQIKDPDEELTDFIFSRYFLGVHGDKTGRHIEKGYAEVSENLLQQALVTCLKVYNEGTKQNLNLAFFSRAVVRIARISRILALQTGNAGNAVLFGVRGMSGRSTLVKMAAFIAKCKVFEPKSQTNVDGNLTVFREMTKQCFLNAGLHGKPGVIIVSDALGDDCLKEAVHIMTSGELPCGYTDKEEHAIISQMFPGQTKRFDKVLQAFDKFSQRVRHNVHFIFCLSYTINNSDSTPRISHSEMAKYPALFKYCHNIDIYRPWTPTELQFTAKTWLMEKNALKSVPHVQLDRLSEAMVYIHNSASAAVTDQFKHRLPFSCFYSPLIYEEFTEIIDVIARQITQTENMNIMRHDAALDRVKKAEERIAKHQTEVDKLMPKYRSAMSVVDDKVKSVEKHKSAYVTALESCKQEEGQISGLLGPMADLKKKAQAEFDKINPIYYAALEALESLSKEAIAEIKSFPSPPHGVRVVLDAVCLMFNKPQNWEEAKLLLLKDSFFNDLQFYDKDKMSDDVYEGLTSYVENPLFDSDKIRSISLATSLLCHWIKAIYRYATIFRGMKPRLAKLMDAESEAKKAQIVLTQKRISAGNKKKELESQIEEHSEAFKHAKTIERQIQAIENKISEAVNVMDNMAVEKQRWQTDRKLSKRKLNSLHGDALLSAAIVCYFGPLNNQYRLRLLNDWLERCKSGIFDVAMETTGRGTYVTSKIDRVFQTRCFIAESVTSLPAGENPNIGTPIKQYSSSSASSMGGRNSADQNYLRIRDNFCLEEILSSFEEQGDWYKRHLPTDLRTVQNILTMRTSADNCRHCWTLLIDPENLGEQYVRLLRGRDIEGDAVESESDGSSSEITNEETVEIPTARTDEVTLQPTYRSQLSTISRGISKFSSIDDFTAVNHVFDIESLFTPRSDDRPVLKPPIDGVRVVKSTDKLLDDYVEQAVSKARLISIVVLLGYALLITNIERKPLDVVYQSLIHKQYQTEADGTKTIKISTRQIKYHENFRLYLSMSTPLTLQGRAGVESNGLTLNKLILIDLSMNEEGLANWLWMETMSYERPEYEAQLRSYETEIFNQRTNIQGEQEKIKSKIVDLQTSLLADDTLLDDLNECRERLAKNELILSDTNSNVRELESKVRPYLRLIETATTAYGVIKRLEMLNPFYYTRLKRFKQIFTETVSSHQRGKGLSGDVKARCCELINALLSNISRYVNAMMFESHSRLFPILLTLELLLSNKSMTRAEYEVFIRAAETSRGSDLFMKPSWMTTEAWSQCEGLREILPAFDKLQDSLHENQKQWREYFKLPVSLMNPLPDDQFFGLTTIQKCLIWRCAYSEKFVEVCEALTLQELGEISEGHDAQLDLHDAYVNSSSYTPVILVLPSASTTNAGVLSRNLTESLNELSKDCQMFRRVHVMNLGSDVQMQLVADRLKRCMKAGDWLVLQNAHLVEKWSQESVEILQEVLDQSETSDLEVKSTFRLWITTKSDSRVEIIPGVLIEYSLKVTCELRGNIKSTIDKCYDAVGKITDQWNALYPRDQWLSDADWLKKLLVLLHSVLVHRQNYTGASAIYEQTPGWTYKEIETSLNALLTVMTREQTCFGLKTIVTATYGGLCQNKADRCGVDSLLQLLLNVVFKSDHNQASFGKNDMTSLWLALDHERKDVIINKLDELSSVTGQMLGAHSLVDSLHTAANSRCLIDDLLTVEGVVNDVESGGGGETVQPHSANIRILEHHLQSVLKLPSLPATNSLAFNPMEIFFHHEVERFQRQQNRLQADLESIISGIRGDGALTPQLVEMWRSISTNTIPSAWQRDSSVTGETLTDWLNLIASRRQTMKSYIEQTDSIVLYRLPVFNRPEQFIQTILQHHAVTHYCDVHNLKLVQQFLPFNSDEPSRPPPCGVYLPDLLVRHASWDSTNSTLTDHHDDDSRRHISQRMPIVWLKPIDTTQSETVVTTDTIETLQCPVYLNDSNGSDPIMHLDLPCEKTADWWIPKNVHLVVKL